VCATTDKIFVSCIRFSFFCVWSPALASVTFTHERTVGEQDVKNRFANLKNEGPNGKREEHLLGRSWTPPPLALSMTALKFSNVSKILNFCTLKLGTLFGNTTYPTSINKEFIQYTWVDA
jgi:hypothetical protein